jgi:hypothetical protein
MVRIGSRKWTLAQITHLMALIDEDSFAASIAASLKINRRHLRYARSLGSTPAYVKSIHRD